MRTGCSAALRRWIWFGPLVLGIALSVVCDDGPSSPAGSSNRLSLSTTSVEFRATQNGAIPGQQSVQVTNGGRGTLSGLALSWTYGPAAPAAPAAPNWVLATLNQSTTPTVIRVGLTTTDMSPGTYLARVTVSSPGVAPVEFQVTCVVTAAAAPQISLSRTTVGFNAAAGGANPAAETVSITNGGSGALSGLATGITYQSAQPTGWLSASLSSTNAPSTLTLNAATGSLAAGTYNATVSVTSPVASNSPQTIAVTFTVTGTPSTKGSIKVIVATGGQNIDPTGYVVKATTGGGLVATANVNANGFVVFPDIAPGTQTVTLEDIAANCVVGGSNPRTVTVVVGATVETTFNVTCSAPTKGSIRVNVATTGQNLDPNGYTVRVTVGGGLVTTQNVGTNGFVVFSNIAPGSQTVTLEGVAANCVAGGSNPRTVTVVAGTTAETTFNVTCSAPVTRRINIVNGIASGLNLQQVVQVKVAATEPGVFTRNDLLTDDPATCMVLPGEAIDRGSSRTFDITVGNNYSVYIGIGIWDEDNCPPYVRYFKRRFFTDPNYYLYYVWVVVNVQGHTSGEWQWIVSGSYLNGTLAVVPKGSPKIPFNVTSGNPIP